MRVPESERPPVDVRSYLRRAITEDLPQLDDESRVRVESIALALYRLGWERCTAAVVERLTR